MNIKDMPHVTVEQVLALRKAAIELEQELATARQEATAYRISLENAEQLIREFIECRVEVGDTWGVTYGQFDEACKKANKLETGNE